MIIIRQAEVYNPEYLGKQDVLICGGRVEAVADHLEIGYGCQEIDARGCLLVPGFIDQHEHIIGGGGEGSFCTRSPEIQLSSLIEAGITTVLGLLGTDDMTRSVENLVAKAKALKEEGISAYALCGAYGYPSPTITGSVKKDIVFVDEVIGVKLALSDHRAPNISTEELIRLASDVHTAGMVSGKPGIIVVHMGSGFRRLEPIFDALKRTDIPVKTFHPTHMSRTEELLEDGFRFAKMGGYVDITCEDIQRIPEGKLGTGAMLRLLEKAGQEGVPMDRLTFSSDGQGSWSSYDESGHLKEIGVTDVGNLFRQFRHLAVDGAMDLTQALSFFTSNVAKALEIYPKKGCIAGGADADMLLLRPDLTLDTVIARGAVMMRDGIVLKKGTYEHD